MYNNFATNIYNLDELYFNCEKPKAKQGETQTYAVIDSRADATGGWGSTDTDSKAASWSIPPGWELTDFKTDILEQAGDRSHSVTKTSTGIEATVWAKGHPKGEANNRSYIHITVTVTITKI